MKTESKASENHPKKPAKSPQKIEKLSENQVLKKSSEKSSKSASQKALPVNQASENHQKFGQKAPMVLPVSGEGNTDNTDNTGTAFNK
jgi:DNA replication protein DnaD